MSCEERKAARDVPLVLINVFVLMFDTADLLFLCIELPAHVGSMASICFSPLCFLRVYIYHSARTGCARVSGLGFLCVRDEGGGSDTIPR